MKFSEEALILELIWEYDYSQEEATEIVTSYLEHSKYNKLIEKLLSKSSKGIPMNKEA